MPASSLFAGPRIAVAGRHRSALRHTEHGLADALADRAATVGIDVAATPLGMLRLLREGARAVMIDRCEAVHLLDARLAPAALMLRARLGVPVTATLSARDLRPARLTTLSRLDHAFTHDEGLAEELHLRAPRLQVTVTDPAVSALPVPSNRALKSMTRLLRDIPPGKAIVAMPWPADGEQVRWFRDAVAPLLHGTPVCLLLGAPGRRQARLVAGAIGLRGSIRVHIGSLDMDTLSAAARCVDAFVVSAEVQATGRLDDVLLALTASRVPVVTGGGVCSVVLQHERSGFAVEPSDAMGVVGTLNQLLALPAIQRHYLGEEFSEYALRRWSWDAVAETYLDRFAALVGRPRIPAELRAAA